MNDVSKVTDGPTTTNDRVYAYILRAIGLAKVFAQRQSHDRYKFVGFSCYVINAMALSAVMSARHGEVSIFGNIPLAADDGPECEALACADHYLDRRNLLSLKGPGFTGRHLWVSNAAIPGYDVAKFTVMALKAFPDVPAKLGIISPVLAFHGLGNKIDYLMREDKSRPLSKPSLLIDKWSWFGILDGDHDYKNNACGKIKTSNDPEWFVKLPISKKYAL